MFAYCNNNPVMGYDPTGYFDWNSFIDFLTSFFENTFGAGVVQADSYEIVEIETILVGA